VLVLHVHDNQWLHELGYLRQALLERLHDQLPTVDVESIEMRIGRIPATTDTGGPVPDRPMPAPLSLNPPAETLAALNHIDDHELREAIAAARYALGGGLKR